MQRLASLALAIASVLSLGSIASADVIPPGEAACQSSSAGAACRVDGASGTCVTSRCSRLDYASWDRDASPSPPSVEYDCLVCEAGAPSTGGDEGGCSVSAVGAGSSSLGLFVAVSALASWSLRRRRARR